MLAMLLAYENIFFLSLSPFSLIARARKATSPTSAADARLGGGRAGPASRRRGGVPPEVGEVSAQLALERPRADRGRR